MNEEQRQTNGEESLAELLRMAGPRPRIPEDMKARVRASVQSEWKDEVSRRKRTRVAAISSLAAAAAVTAVILLKPQAPTAQVPQPVVVARVQTVNGTATASVGETVMSGRTIETGIGSTASLDWSGATLRLDRGTKLRLDSRQVATLEAGAIYFADAPQRNGIEIRTPFGSVRDIGTRFEVRLENDMLHVRVREGRVDLRRGDSVVTADAGTELIATAASVQSRTIDRSGDQWAWIENAAPPLVLEGMKLGDVLSRVSDEKGLTLVLKRGELSSKQLHGNVPLSPDEALHAATTATGARYRIENDRLVVE